MSDRITVTITEQEPVAFQTHKIGAHVLFDEHGLSPYYGLISCFKPDHDETLDVLRGLADTITLNPDYFAGEPHEWSRVTALETYVRLDRQDMEQHVTARAA